MIHHRLTKAGELAILDLERFTAVYGAPESQRTERYLRAADRDRFARELIKQARREAAALPFALRRKHFDMVARVYDREAAASTRETGTG